MAKTWIAMKCEGNRWVEARQGPVLLTFFVRNLNSMEISPCCYSVAGHTIATNFCTCHDSTAAVPCTKFCSDHCIKIEVRVKQNFHRIWIAMEKPLVKRAPGVIAELRGVWCSHYLASASPVPLTLRLVSNNAELWQLWNKMCSFEVEYAHNGRRPGLAIHIEQNRDSNAI